MEQIAAGAVSPHALDLRMLSSKALLLAGRTTTQDQEDAQTKICEVAARLKKKVQPHAFGQLNDLKRGSRTVYR